MGLIATDSAVATRLPTAAVARAISTGLNTTPERLREQFSAAIVITPTRARSC